MTQFSEEEFIKGLSLKQKAIILASSKRRKKFSAIRKHTKVRNGYVFSEKQMMSLYDLSGEWWKGPRLSPLGLTIKKRLLGEIH